MSKYSNTIDYLILLFCFKRGGGRSRSIAIATEILSIMEHNVHETTFVFCTMVRSPQSRVTQVGMKKHKRVALLQISRWRQLLRPDADVIIRLPYIEMTIFYHMQDAVLQVYFSFFYTLLFCVEYLVLENPLKSSQYSVSFTLGFKH